MDKNQMAVKEMQEGNIEEAAKLLNELIEENPKDAIAFTNFGNLLSAVGEEEKAIVFYEKAVEINDDLATAYYGKANVLFNQEKFTESIDMYQESITKGLLEGDVYYMLGMSFYQLGDFRRALPSLSRAVELNGEDVDARFHYGMSLAQTEQIDDAIVQFNEVIKQEEHADSYFNLGVAYAYKDNANKALEMFNKALDIQPDHMLSANGKKQMEEVLEQGE